MGSFSVIKENPLLFHGVAAGFLFFELGARAGGVQISKVIFNFKPRSPPEMKTASQTPCLCPAAGVCPLSLSFVFWVCSGGV